MTLAPALAITILLLIAVIDWQRHEIWHAITVPSIILAIISAPSLPARFTPNAILGALSGFALFILIRAVAIQYYGEGAIGFGDVMLAALIGALGGLINGLLWLAIGMLLAGLVAVRVKLSQSLATHIAYGTWLAVGAVLGLVFVSLR